MLCCSCVFLLCCCRHRCCVAVAVIENVAMWLCFGLWLWPRAGCKCRLLFTGRVNSHGCWHDGRVVVMLLALEYSRRRPLTGSANGARRAHTFKFNWPGFSFQGETKTRVRVGVAWVPCSQTRALLVPSRVQQPSRTFACRVASGNGICDVGRQ